MDGKLDAICNPAAQIPNTFQVTHVAQTLRTSVWTQARTSTREQYEHNPLGFVFFFWED